jgi:chromosomal replication initiation ATPase DnaA
MKKNIFKEYASSCAKLFGITEDELFTKSKRRDIVDARHMLYFLCSERPMKIVYIQEYMLTNGYQINHSSIIYGIKQMRNKMSEDKDYKKAVKSIKTCTTL